MAECIARCRIWNYISYNWNYSTQVSNKDNNVQTKGLSLKTRAQNIDILIYEEPGQNIPGILIMEMVETRVI